MTTMALAQKATKWKHELRENLIVAYRRAGGMPILSKTIVGRNAIIDIAVAEAASLTLTLPLPQASTRTDALEEAAKIAEGHATEGESYFGTSGSWNAACTDIADAIRALKDTDITSNEREG